MYTQKRRNGKSSRAARLRLWNAASTRHTRKCPTNSRAYMNGPSARILELERHRLRAGAARRNHKRRAAAVSFGKRHVRRFHFRNPAQISGCSHRCMVSTRRRSHSPRMCCTSSGGSPGFQHERSRLLRKSAANSSSPAAVLAVAGPPWSALPVGVVGVRYLVALGGPPFARRWRSCAALLPRPAPLGEGVMNGRPRTKYTSCFVALSEAACSWSRDIRKSESVVPFLLAKIDIAHERRPRRGAPSVRRMRTERALRGAYSTYTVPEPRHRDLS